MCTPEAIAVMQTGQVISGAVEATTEGRLSEIDLKTNAAIEMVNIKLLEEKKKEVKRTVKQQEQQIMKRAAQIEGQQIALMGASGVSLSSPSFQKILEASDINEAIDISLIRESGNNQISSLDLAIGQKRSTALGLTGAARQVRKNTNRGIFINTLTGASNVAGSYFINNALFEKYNLKSAKAKTTPIKKSPKQIRI